MSESPILARNVAKAYGRKAVLEGVDLDIPPGSVVGLLGRNGAGKTTLLKCLLGLLRPDSGAIEIMGRDPDDLDADTKSRLGYVPQDVELYPWMSVRSVLDYTGAFYPVYNESFVRETAAQWGLDLDMRVGTLSKGQLQKLGILLALGHEPELVILDEPAASLDPAARRSFLATLIGLVADLGQTVLFSTHITSDLERIADRVAILKDGRIAYHDEIDRLKESIKRIRLIGSTPLPRGMVVPEALHLRVRGNEAVLSVSSCNDRLVDRLEREWSATAEVQDLNLEDIFLEVHHG